MRSKQTNNKQKVPLSGTDFSVPEKGHMRRNPYLLAAYGTILTLKEQKFRTKEFERKLNQAQGSVMKRSKFKNQ